MFDEFGDEINHIDLITNWFQNEWQCKCNQLTNEWWKN